MQFIYELIQKNPEYYAWAFGLINALWLGFVYFNKQSHERSLKQLEQELRFRADRRLKIFDLKASEYGKYVANLDSFGKKNEIEMPERMQPIFDEYLQRYLAATEAGDKEQERIVIGWLSSQVSSLMQEGLKDVLKLKSESNRLKLIATDEMLETFNQLEKLTQESMDCTNEYMKNFTDIIFKQQTEKTEAFQKRTAELGAETQKNSKALLNQMRQELSDI
jgi:predicted outer membrane lipoprotein